MPNETNATDPEDKALLDEVEKSLQPEEKGSGKAAGKSSASKATAKKAADAKTADASSIDEPVILPEPPRDVWTAPVNEPKPEPKIAVVSPATAPASVPEPRRRSGIGSFLGMVVGGALCTGAGFWLGESGLLRAPAMDRLAAELGSQQNEIAQLKTGLASLPAPAADADLSARIAALEAAEKTPAPAAAEPELDSRLSALETRISGLQSGGASADPALGAEVAALKTQIEQLQSGGGQAVEAALAGVRDQIAAASAEASGLAQKAEAATRQTLALAAVSQIGAALDSGLPFASALANLDAPAPAVLVDAAQSGLPTLTQLRDRFPEAARNGLEAALHADLGASWTERAGNFLRAQTGARSLSPREGNDPDAILSRAEAAIGAGDVAGTLALIKTLPEAAQTAMSGWTALAEHRLAAEAALAELAAKTGGQ